MTTILSRRIINISYMEVSRKDKGDTAIIVIEVDEKIDDHITEELKQIDNLTAL